MAGELFRDVRQWEFQWEGRVAKLPVFYYDVTSATAIFTASSAAVKKLLPHPKMHLQELTPGKCLAAFTAFEYRKTDIDPYNEFSISFPIVFGKPSIPGATIAWQLLRRRFSAYVWQLPVTTEIARVGGVDLYGYPKFLADIVFRREPNWLECEISENGQRILVLRGKAMPGAPGKLMRYATYSVKDGIPLRANVCVNPREFAQSRAPEAAALTLGEAHPIAATLRGIGLSAQPMMYQFSPVNETILFAGRNLMDD